MLKMVELKRQWNNEKGAKPASSIEKVGHVRGTSYK